MTHAWFSWVRSKDIEIITDTTFKAIKVELMLQGSKKESAFLFSWSYIYHIRIKQQ